MNNKELVLRLAALVGGEENVLNVKNCTARLRITVKDSTKVKADEIKATEGVLGFALDGNTCHIVLELHTALY